MSLPTAKTHRDVTCPFCALLCDDLAVVDESGGMRVTSTNCPRAQAGFSRPPVATEPCIEGKPESPENALIRAAQILRKSEQPLLAGLGLDVAACRAALALAEKCGAIVDHMHGDSQFHNLRVLQSQGWILTTLGELKNRADCILFVGTDATTLHPRFFERFVWPPHALRAEAISKQVMFLGGKTDARAGVSPAGTRPLSLPCADTEIPSMVGALRALFNTRPPDAFAHVSAAQLRMLKKIRDRLLGAGYAVIVWSAGALRSRHADLTVRSLCSLIQLLNRTTRAAGLPLGGNDGAVSWTNACTWQSGFPSRVNFAGGAPAFDPALHAYKTLLAAGAADALLWTSCFDPEPGPGPRRVPTIVVGQATARQMREADVYLPASVPGLDHAGHLFRLDGVISLPLRALRASGARPAAQWLDEIRKRI